MAPVPWVPMVAHIENWVHVPLPRWSKGYLIGEVTNHPAQETFKDALQITAAIKEIDYEKNTMETVDGVKFTLGKKR